MSWNGEDRFSFCCLFPKWDSTVKLTALHSDYRGAVAAGMHALLLRRPGPEGEGAHRDKGEDLSGVQVISNLGEVTRWVMQYSRQ